MASALKGTVQSLLGRASPASAPKEPSADELERARARYDAAGQGHVFAFWEQLDGAQKAALFAQLQQFDAAHITALAAKALSPSDAAAASTPSEAGLDALPASATASALDSPAADLEAWYQHGLALVAQNKVAVVLMAGGQGTRLGSAAPKGCYDIGLPSRKSLFRLQAERILRVQHLGAKSAGVADAVVPWYVMTSGPTRGPTEEYFAQNDYFGLKKENVVIFEQGVLPCISNDGKIILESKSKVAVAPDGNGGLYQALITSGVVADMKKRGVQHVHAYCVDNCLVRVADPTFVGFAASKHVDIATKAVRKRDAREAVGMIVQKNWRPDVVEYSEVDAATAEAKDPHNPQLLKYRTANIVNHYYSYGFLESIPLWAHRLPHHVAKKKIPYADAKSGETAKPEKPNGIKLEQFVFDCFPFLTMDKFACLEVRREDEFSPLKNARGTGEDDPDTSKRDIMSQGRRWAEAAGAVVTDKGDAAGVEVSPLVSYGGEGLESLKGKSITAPAVIDKVD